MLLAITVFALVLSVAALAVAGWTLSASNVTAHLMRSENDAIIHSLKNSSQEQLRAEVDDLRGALDVIRTSNRKEFGALWGRLGGKPNGRVIEGTFASTDDDLQAVLALQNAKPAQP